MQEAEDGGEKTVGRFVVLNHRNRWVCGADRNASYDAARGPAGWCVVDDRCRAGTFGDARPEGLRPWQTNTFGGPWAER